MTDKIKQCPVCNERYDSISNTCPNCGYKKPVNSAKSLLILSVIFLILTICANADFKENIELLNNFKLNVFSENKNITDNSEENEININLRKMSELSYLSRNDILEKRKKYVKESVIFKDENYTPREDVYLIEDNLAWISAYEIALNGAKDNKNIGKGASRNSISVNNPELLFTFLVPDFNGKNSDITKFSEADYFLPKKLLWNKKENTLKAYFDFKSFFELNPDYNYISMYFDETNARDMGYNWVYCEKSENIRFINRNNNISISPYQMRGYYHRGYSCGLEEGCNNYSPYQEELVYNAYPPSGYLRLKMWKNKPVSKYQHPDIVYEIYL